MENDINEKPMTIKDFQEVIMPAMEEVFATKKDIDVLRRDFSQFKHEILLSHDKILKDLDILMTEKEVGYFQKKKERKLWAIMIDALQKHQILSNEQIQEIKALEIF